ncbi:MAG: ABC transporter permease [Gammaproteobacteria bacterium]|nr:ABC transporter permease [Gammaproteobacteria bacterium]
MSFSIRFAWRDLRASGHTLWVFCVCLMLGVTLVAATGGLYRQIGGALLDDTRALMGGDLEVEARTPLPDDVLAWMRERGTVSLLTEVRTVMGTPDGGIQVVELQSVDEHYPLYGELVLEPGESLETVTSREGGQWGLALDGMIAERLDIQIGDEVAVGSLTMEVRALVRHQPDRSLQANWRGAPALISPEALDASELVGPASRVEYEYRVRTEADAGEWRRRFYAAFPEGEWEVDTFAGRSERIAERLGQVASALLIIGFSTLFIGGLGVYNSIQAYLQGKLSTIATLRALGLRNGMLAAVYLLQVGILALGASLAGALAGFGIALAGAIVAAEEMHFDTAAAGMLPALFVAVAFGLLTAFTFAMPAIGRALSIDPAALFRMIDGSATATPKRWWAATAAGCVLIVLLVVLVLPDPLFGLGFIAVAGGLLALLEGIVRGLRRLARALDDHPALRSRFALRLAVANMQRPGSPLRTTLLSLGSALTLLVACAIVVGGLVRAINETIPGEAPALVLYDISDDQLDDVVNALHTASDAARVDTAPLVLGRLRAVNGEPLRGSGDERHEREARDEHKLTYRANNIDNVTLERGLWWTGEDASGIARVAMEDREADQLGLRVGDRLTFAIADGELDAELTGVYRQKGMQTSFWFEAIFSDGALDPFIYRYVGAAYMSDATALTAQKAIAGMAPNVVTVRTEAILQTARGLLGQAVAGLAVIALVSLGVSLLVLTGVMATSRTRQVYDATILHSLGTRLRAIGHSLHLEYALLALITSLFAIVMGSAIAVPLLAWRLKLPVEAPLLLGVMVALSVSGLCLYLGARYLLRRLRLNPAMLLRSGG